MTPVENVPSKGEILAGKYEVEAIIGSGGMGIVLAAQHVVLRQRVALKVLRAAAVSLPGAAERFIREAQAAAAIQSEHVARVLDVGTLEDGAPFIVLEYLSGVDLARLLKQRGPLSIEDAVDFVLQASEAVAHAHTLRIVHRDLKPANLFLTQRAEGSPLVKVLDFGLSKIVDGETTDGSLTATTVVAGSPFYMSPEQLRSLKHVDARTDVWSLGVILYELLAGRRPFEGSTATAICASVVADAPLPLRLHRPDVPAALEALILQCLQKDPGLRVPTVAHFAVALAPFAPRRSESLIEVIRRLLPIAAPPGGSAPWLLQSSLNEPMATVTAPPEQAAPPFATSPTGPLTWDRTQAQGPQLRVALIIGGALLAALAVVGIVLLTVSKTPEQLPAPAAPVASSEAPLVTPAPSPAVVEAPSLTPSASAAPSASASAVASAAPSASASAVASAAPSATAQVPGPQTASPRGSTQPTAPAASGRKPSTNPLDQF